MTQTKKITRDEAIKRCELMASVIPGSKVRRNAWNVTLISRNGKHLVCYTGRKDGFRKA